MPNKRVTPEMSAKLDAFMVIQAECERIAEMAMKEQSISGSSEFFKSLKDMWKVKSREADMAFLAALEVLAEVPESSEANKLREYYPKRKGALARVTK